MSDKKNPEVVEITEVEETKEKLYKHILGRVRAMHPNFNIGITTGGGLEGAWSKPYRHWAFVPSDHDYDKSLTKGQK